jgi:dTDP-4-dehydrorhamnose 3,5-epimerase
MRFSELPIPGAFLVEIEPREDERGFFARTVCTEEFSRHGLNAAFVQQSVSWNVRRGTLRGLHYQTAPWEEEKLVRVTQGAIFDVIVDLRPGSATFARWHGVELSAGNHAALYMPKGLAHGFQTLSDATEVFYEMTVPYHPEAVRGVRWDDPQLAIAWPDPAGALASPRDVSLPLLKEALP